MSRINLLPWRAELREKLQRRFLISLGASAALAAAAAFAVYSFYQSSIEYQGERNAYLVQEIAALDAKIEEIKELEAIKESVINRIQVIEQLQQQRPQIVHLFDEWLDTLPEGVYLTGIEQLGSIAPSTAASPVVDSTGIARLKGNAQSNGRVSSYMKELEASDWLAKPRLVIIQTKDADNGTRSSEFTLTVQQRNPLLERLKEEQENDETPANADPGADS